MTEPPFSDLSGAVRRILELQRSDGAIPWVEAGVVDPWNHAECAMALAVAGRREAAHQALVFLEKTQNADGSWWADYGNAAPIDANAQRMTGPNGPPIRDTNYTAYPTVALWRLYRLERDAGLLARFSPTVFRALDFVLALQSPHGDVRWAAPDPHASHDDALVAGNAAIHKSLDAGAAIARAIGEDERAAWLLAARRRLGDALRHKAHRFDRSWGSKRHFSMDWYYPVLSDALSASASRTRLAARWSEFVMPDHGCRCVSSQPWVTVAETCELALACLKVGWRATARSLLAWIETQRGVDGAYWMGRQVRDEVFWPEDRPSWTAAAAILAHDAFHRRTPGWDVLIAPQAAPRDAATPQAI